jgi:hypothetical protein
MSRRRILEAILLILLAALAAVAVKTLSGASPLRIAAGIALVLGLPWLAASRLAPIRRDDTTAGRLAAAGALAIAATILLGLLLSTLPVGITADRTLAGALGIVVVLAILGLPEKPGRLRAIWRITSPLGWTLVVVAVAISIFAFTLARNRALTQAQRETAYAAFLIEDGKQLSVGLRNPTDRPARFTVRDLRRGPSSAVVVPVPPHRTRIVPGFVAKPHPLRPIQRLQPEWVNPTVIRIHVSVAGRRGGRPLTLSTYAP